MRSLKDAGLVSLPRFAKFGEIGGLPFEILDAVCRAGQFGPEIVYTLNVLTEDEAPLFYDSEGEPVGPVVAISFAEAPSRLRHVEYFGTRRAESLGPCRFEQLPSKQIGQSGYIDIVDCEDAVDTIPHVATAALSAASTAPLSGEAAKKRAAAAVAARNGRSAPARHDDDGDLEDLPF